MRACFMGPNIFALGYGVATLQTPRLSPLDEETGKPLAEAQCPVDNAPTPMPAPQPVLPVLRSL